MKIITTISNDKKDKRNSFCYRIDIQAKATKSGDGYFFGAGLDACGKDELEARSNAYPLIRELYDTLEAFILENDVM